MKSEKHMTKGVKILLGLGLKGVWMGIVVGNILAVLITFIWGKYTVEDVI